MGVPAICRDCVRNKEVSGLQCHHLSLPASRIGYIPQETPLTRTAVELGCRNIVYGLEILVLQGIEQSMLWTGMPREAFGNDVYEKAENVGQLHCAQWQVAFIGSYKYPTTLLASEVELQDIWVPGGRVIEGVDFINGISQSFRRITMVTEEDLRAALSGDEDEVQTS
ncbi:hypothetical protein FOZ63_027743 [Perkinsus olseni]|uniref:Uncharacterized protein n=1 Tax=Perkinsus olseni TaxID=32597 RepID=A0A7J6SFK7_PEROL|nr:hypothetical protein FOZ63_027743 [Perkinsus olseni]